jgi:hypothetical protein
VVFGIKDALLLREENAVLEIGVMKNSGPPIPLQALFRDRVIGGRPASVLRRVTENNAAPYVVWSRRRATAGCGSWCVRCVASKKARTSAGKNTGSNVSNVVLNT